MAEAPSVVGTTAGASNSEGAMLAATSLGTILSDGMRGSTPEAFRLPAPIELDEAWEASEGDWPEDDMES